MIFKAVITKSKEVSEMLSNAFEIEKQEYIELYRNTEINIHYGQLYEDASFPAIYHNQNYFYTCLVVHTNKDNKYDLIIA